MKHEPMTQQPRRTDPKTPRKKGDAAFDLWLQRGLHKLFDDVAREPIPDELLRLIEDDREGGSGQGADAPGPEPGPGGGASGSSGGGPRPTGGR
jgi:hypothetical protein